MSFRYTQEELDIAKSVDLVSIAEYLGFTPKKVGSYYTFKEIDSMRIFNRNSWYRFSKKNENGYFCGSQIEFLEEFAGLSFRESVKWLLDYTGYRKNYSDIDQKKGLDICKGINEDKHLVLPEASETNNHIYTYLNQKRGISSSIIDFFLDKKLIYESAKYSNVVFKGLDSGGKVRFASMRGIHDTPGKKPFKYDVVGSDKNYGFNISSANSDSIAVFEGAIDLISYLDISQDYDLNMLALGMTSDKPLERFLKEHSNVRSIILYLDNDKPGRDASNVICNKYTNLGYQVNQRSAPGQYKDINEWLVSTKLSLADVPKNQIVL